MLSNMRKLSAGTITDLELMQQANQALLLGLPVDRFGDMLQIARSSAKATGQSMEFMLQSIVTGLGRGSKLMLDNLGIMIDTNKAYEKYARTLGKTAEALTDAEKKQAFINEALAIGKKNAEAAGGSVESSTDKWEQLKTSLQNIAIELGQKVLPFFDSVVTSLRDVAKWTEDLIKGDDQLTIAKKNLTAAWTEQAKAQMKLDELQKQGADEKMIKWAQEWVTASQAKVTQMKAEHDALRQKYQNEKTLRDQELAEKKALLDAEAQAKAEQQTIDAERDAIKKEMDLENQKLFNEAMKNEENMAQMELKNQAIMNATSREQALAAIKDKEKFKNKLVEEEKRKQAQKTFDFEKFLNSQKVKDFQMVMGQISALQESKNKELVAIGKAAAIANIGISTAEGVMKSYALGGPIFGSILAGLVIAAGAVQSAKVAGVALADGGVVSATQGGVPAIIGEGGRDEAVVPLEDDDRIGGLGSTINITVNGGLLGDENSARELALAIDSELLKLRRNNESVAFESGVV